jgi:dipeptidyl aminopeptidase/acylaminoacyl peptidase
MEEFIPKRFRPINVETTLAQLGCIVVRFGNRGGTRLRGLEYWAHERDRFRDYGLADKRAVIEELGERFDFIDLDRVGIFGGSSGGFMTVSAMLVHPDFFKVGVAMTGPHVPTLQSSEWVERYAGVKRVAGEDGVESWRAATVESNEEIADRLAGRLLMIYGAQDEIVPLSHLYRMTAAFIKANKRVDQFVMPGTGHGLSPWQYTYGMVWTYFAENLIGDHRSDVEVFPADGGEKRVSD